MSTSMKVNTTFIAIQRQLAKLAKIVVGPVAVYNPPHKYAPSSRVKYNVYQLLSSVRRYRPHGKTRFGKEVYWADKSDWKNVFISIIYFGLMLANWLTVWWCWHRMSIISGIVMTTLVFERVPIALSVRRFTASSNFS